MRLINLNTLLYFVTFLLTLINNIDNIYAQTTGIWLNKINVPTVNGCSNATCDAQQTIAFAIGDSVFCGSNAGFYRYERYSDTYITKQSIGYITNVMASCSINGKGYILANAGGIPRIYEYNPINNSWSSKQQFPGSTKSAPAYFVLNNKLYIVSGVTTAYNSNTLNNFPVNEVWEYNPAVDVFLRKADINFSGSLGILLPSVPNKPRGFSIDNFGYVLWGPGAFYQYDPVIDVWYNKPSPLSSNPNIRYACQSGATCLIFNGFSFQGYGYCLVTDLQQSQQNKAFLRYDPSVEQWTTIYTIYQVNGFQYFDNAVYSTSWTNTSRNVFGFYDENLYNSSNGRGYNCEWTPNDYAIYTSQVIQPNPPCIGPNENTNYQLQFTAVGNYSVANNIFYLQLSDANGNFNTPQNIDSIVTGTSTQYVGTFNINLPPSVWDTTRNYKLRVIATNPYSDDEHWTPVKKYIVLNPDTSVSLSGPTTFCSGSFVTIRPTTGAGYTYEWYKNGILINGVTSSSYSATSSGAYYCKITNSNGCSVNTRSITVNVVSPPTAPTISASGPTSFCQGGSVTLTSSSTTGNVWSTGATTQSITVTSNGTFTVTVSNGNCNAMSAATTITVNTNTAPTFNTYGPYCVGATPGSLPTTSSNGITGTWSPSNISTANAGTSTYTFTPTAGLCATTATRTVTINANITPTFNSCNSILRRRNTG
ncbi:MAG: hypothetical protein IPM95_12495 [Sphingobacteriales bacterium]|nr:hypothetical protein [Sphingobacteriales bacterium]